MDKGIYCLIFRNPACSQIVGALGEIRFRPGWHIYVGSALGSGGLARLERHVKLAALKDKRPKWHVDSLLTSDLFRLDGTVFATTAEPRECELAEAVGGPCIPRFGCSDCDCPSHLFFRRHSPYTEVKEAFRTMGLVPAATILRGNGSKGYL